MRRVLQIRIAAASDGRLLRDYLRREWNVSTALLRKIKTYPNGMLLNGKPVFVTAPVHTGDILELLLDDGAAQSAYTPCTLPVSAVYEDDDLLLVDKPAGMPVHPGPGHHGDTLSDAVVTGYQARGQRFVFRPVNRLDAGTSGLLAIAKNAYIHQRLKQQLHTDAFIREYLAVAVGVIDRPGTIDAPIARCADSVIRRRVDAAGAPAVTTYTPVRCANGYTLLRLRLYTGRTHQIRVHLAYIGHPLAGDFLYGAELPGFHRVALHACLLALQHPLTGQTLTFESPLPAPLAALLGDV